MPPAANSLYPNYNGETINKRQSLSLSSSPAKRHSPKHRILHHRQYSSPSSTPIPSNSNLETAENLSVQYSTSPSSRAVLPSAASSNSLGLTPPSPYRSPSHVNNAPTSPSASASPHETRARILSGGDSAAGQNNVLAGQKRPAAINADSELVQLLRTNKYSKVEELQLLQQQQKQQQFLNEFSSSLAPKIKVDVEERLQLAEQLRARSINNTLDLNALKGFPLASQSTASPPGLDQALLPGQVKVEYPPGNELHPGFLNQQALIPRPRPGELQRRQQPMVKTLIVPITRPVPPVPARDQLLVTPKSSPAPSQRPPQPSLKDQKRRGGSGSKNGFDLLRSLIPSLNQQNSSVKISKAALLHKGGDYLQQLTAEKAQLTEEIASHRGKIEAMNAAIADLHKTMSAATSSSGGTRSGISSDTYDELEQLFDDHVVRCSHQNWKYWPFSLLMHPLLRSFQSSVDASSYDELQRTCFNWLDQHMSLAQLRPASIKSLTELSRRTELVERNSAEGLAERALVEALRSRRVRNMGGSPNSSPSSGFME